MADELLERVRNALEGQIDFEGQRLAEQLNTVFLTAVGIIAFVVGYTTEDITKTLWVGLGGTALTFVAVVPPWPFFKKNPVDWLPPAQSIAGVAVDVGGIKVD